MGTTRPTRKPTVVLTTAATTTRWWLCSTTPSPKVSWHRPNGRVASTVDGALDLLGVADPLVIA
ncbi:MAG TPA: hypothetical protein VH352_07945 [Pseudonocardiaceae bacterium]|nr:hypothetical protein [Pseudonocardiaceae bacterium]